MKDWLRKFGKRILYILFMIINMLFFLLLLVVSLFSWLFTGYSPINWWADMLDDKNKFNGFFKEIEEV